ncbi:mannose-1-phosphate guanylyltransferase/mannose-6-phosphate isomerase [Sphingomonas sp.]|uniref:mannose-1-phosphate guanylyltransferase/mannose-6-phosphate isomerase n=1 Tax=Sphingomonas sp. TaxID=28214 RepID=UPI002FCC374C
MSDATGRTSRRITPVILCGGSGTRLWPLSRRARPKQMLALTAAGTMLQMTAARVSDRAKFEAPLVIAGAEQADSAVRQLDEAGIAAGGLIVEPVGRNTAPAIALAAASLSEDDLLLVMPSDHLIGEPARFVAAIETAAPVAEAGWLVTFGVQPDRPETGYGYIRRGDQIEPGVFRAERFVEKPDAATAAIYVADGNHAWNAGIFLFRAGTYLDALRAHAPDIAADVREAIDKGVREGIRISPDAALFEAVRAQSIDHAIMEKAEKIALVPVDMDWSDVGSWEALYDASPHDEEGNAVSGEALVVDSSGCLIRSDGPLVTAIGVEDLVIVATGDAVLIIPRKDSQRVREAVALLGERGDPRL